MKITLLLSLFILIFKISAAELRNDLVIFNSAEEALPYVFKAPWNYVNPSLAPGSYRKAEQTLDEIFEPLCKKFEGCKNFPKPIIMLTNNGESASFGLMFDQRRRQSNILLVSEELVYNKLHLEFVVAHELVHYFLLHAETKTADLEIYDIYKTYSGVKEKFDYPFEEVKQDFLMLRDMMKDLGSRAHLVSSAHKFTTTGNFGNLVEKMITEVSKYSSECLRLSVQFKRIKSNQISGQFLNAANSDVIKFLNTARVCFEKHPGNLIEEICESEKLFSDADKETQSIIQRDDPELSRLQEIHTHKMKTYTFLSQKLGGPQIRFENEEDKADLIALGILLELGRRNMRYHTDYLLTDASARDQLKCFSELSENKEPYYGVLTNPHHEECWRIWRAQRVEKEFLKTQEEIKEELQEEL